MFSKNIHILKQSNQISMIYSSWPASHLTQCSLRAAGYFCKPLVCRSFTIATIKGQLETSFVCGKSSKHLKGLKNVASYSTINLIKHREKSRVKEHKCVFIITSCFDRPRHCRCPQSADRWIPIVIIIVIIIMRSELSAWCCCICHCISRDDSTKKRYADGNVPFVDTCTERHDTGRRDICSAGQRGLSHTCWKSVQVCTLENNKPPGWKTTCMHVIHDSMGTQ